MYYMHPQGETILLLLYVDDVFITWSSWLKKFLYTKFKLTDLRKIKHYMGISFEQIIQEILLQLCHLHPPTFWHGRLQTCSHPSSRRPIVGHQHEFSVCRPHVLPPMCRKVHVAHHYQNGHHLCCQLSQ